MELTITQNGALYAVQHAPRKFPRPQRHESASAETTNALPTLRTSVGEFAMRLSEAGCYLELIVGRVHRVLGLYKTANAAREALINRRTGFRTWDALDARNAKAQVGALE
jgi:hypothetical protein